MNRTGTDASPAVLVHDKSAIISWPPISPFSDHLPVVCLGCKTGNVYGSIPPAQKCLTQETVWDVQPVSLLGLVHQVDLHLTQPNG